MKMKISKNVYKKRGVLFAAHFQISRVDTIQIAAQEKNDIGPFAAQRK